MANDSRKKTATFLGATIIGLIIISFMFSGYQSLSRSTPDTIAKVGSFPIKLREYRMEYDRQLKFYKQIMGGKELTSVQIERFNLKNNALRSLANKKMMLIFANELGIRPSDKEISEQIMKLPYFQSNGQFDLDLYKNLLARNQYSPTDFESLTAQDLTNQKLFPILQNIPVSNQYQQDLEKFRSQRFSASMVKFAKNPLKKNIKVTKAQIKSFLKDPKNLARAESIFMENKIKYDQPEQVLGRHILIKGDDAKSEIDSIYKKANPKNFADLANKHTQDPSGKKKGGYLGWFKRGQMVPEFENVAFTQKPGTISKPVKTQFGYHIIYIEKHKKAQLAKFADHKNEIAKELIQSNLAPQVTKMAADLTSKIKKALRANNVKRIESLKKKYQLSFDKATTINRLDGATGSVKLRADELKKIFDYNGKLPKTFTFDTPLDVTLVSLSKAKANKKDKKKANPALALGQKFQQDLIRIMGENVKTKVFMEL